MELTCVIEKGTGKGAFFTSLDWVVEQFQSKLGFRPFPGTLNVRVLEEDLPKLGMFTAEKDLELIPSDPDFCAAGLKRVRINGVPAVAVFPSEDVRVHGKEIIEIISEFNLKASLNLVNGDQVSITDM